MLYRLLADLVVVVHFAFILFVVLGGLLAFRWRRCVWFHLPAVLWAMLIEFAGWVCPLTPLENWLRRRSGATGYGESFIEHYVIPLLYPDMLTRGWQISLGLFVLVLNLGIYGWMMARYAKGRKRDGLDRRD